MVRLNVVTNEITQDWSIARIVNENAPSSWANVFMDAHHELMTVSNVLANEEAAYGTYYPLKKDIFNAFSYTPLTNVKVVIFGQDPYHQLVASGPRAVGLSFSVRQDDVIPSSLKNIYKELKDSVRGFQMPDHGDLREWAMQGILLLNSCLTVRPREAGSHDQIWMGFIKKVIKAINTQNPNCIYVLWGQQAQKLKSIIGDSNIILEAAHPSGLSASRGFFGCNHFNKINELLRKQNKTIIDWSISSRVALNPPLQPINPNLIIKPKLTPIVTTTVTDDILSSHCSSSAHIEILPPPKSLALPVIPGVNSKYSPSSISNFRIAAKNSSPPKEPVAKSKYTESSSPSEPEEPPIIPSIVFTTSIASSINGKGDSKSLASLPSISSLF